MVKMMTKVFKVELLVIDHENIEDDEIYYLLENVKYLYPKVINMQSVDIGEWNDDNPLNHRDTFRSEVDRLFSSEVGS